MNAQAHWGRIYKEKAPDQVSWYRPHLEASLALIDQVGAGQSASIIDVGAGESTLVDDLLGRGYSNVTVLDISQAAIAASQKRLGVRRNGFIGSSPTSRRLNCNPMPTTFGPNWRR